ncbi:MAG: UDP-4-amino-4,6-dideoxy-N-acetyl-beta-L-altrosamine transaminase [Nitratireductor sp.]
MSDDFLPYGKQTITQADLDAVAKALQEPMLTTGPMVGEFEKAFAKRVGSSEAVACANGTAALHLASMALGLGPDDVVLAPSQSFMASANGPHYTGARIVFMDCDPDTGLVTRETFLEALERAGGRASAAVIVHLNGEVADMAAIAAEAKPRGIHLIEDACHAVGTRFAHDGGMAEVGSCKYSDMACFSLHPVKTITMGEGGMVTTNNREWADDMRIKRSHGISRDFSGFINRDLAFDADGSANPWYHEMQAPGFNYRATDFACALGLSQLGQLDHFIERRKALKARYEQLFDGFHPSLRTVPTAQDCDPCRHLYPVLIDFAAIGKSRRAVMAQLHELGIGTQVHYIPVHLQPYYRQLEPGLDLPGAVHYYERALSLPLYPLMQDSDADRVADALRVVLG